MGIGIVGFHGQRALEAGNSLAVAPQLRQYAGVVVQGFRADVLIEGLGDQALGLGEAPLLGAHDAQHMKGVEFARRPAKVLRIKSFRCGEVACAVGPHRELE